MFRPRGPASTLQPGSSRLWRSQSSKDSFSRIAARARVSATLLHPPGHDYYRILRSKLHWGRGTREGQPPGA